MLNELFPERVANALDNIKYSSLCELRLRAESPIVVNSMGKNYYLKDDCISENIEGSLSVSMGVLQSTMQKLSKYSLYSINDQLIDGYISYDGGIRVGVCGEVVSNDGKVKTIKNISSLNFRFPHEIRNCSLGIYQYIYDGDIKNTLIISPPGAGKTTMLRDIIYQFSTRLNLINILVIDERQELTNLFDGKVISKVKNVDVYDNCTKKFAFNNGIRSMKPDVIVTDEINIDRDIDDIENALTSGVKVFASIHASSVFELKSKKGMKDIIDKGLFDRYIVLSCANGIGTIEGVYNQNLKLIGV